MKKNNIRLSSLLALVVTIICACLLLGLAGVLMGCLPHGGIRSSYETPKVPENTVLINADGSTSVYQVNYRFYRLNGGEEEYVIDAEGWVSKDPAGTYVKDENGNWRDKNGNIYQVDENGYIVGKMTPAPTATAIATIATPTPTPTATAIATIATPTPRRTEPARTSVVTRVPMRPTPTPTATAVASIATPTPRLLWIYPNKDDSGSYQANTVDDGHTGSDGGYFPND